MTDSTSRQIEHKFKCKVHIYDTNTEQVWG